MKEKNPVLRETLAVTVGEAIVCLAVVAVYALLRRFSYTVITGAALGAAVVILNFFLLALSTNRAFNEVLAERGDRELTEEEAAAFTEKYKARVQFAVVKSQLLRTGMMLAALVLAFVLPCFEGIATLVPLLMFRPILMIEEFFRKKADHGQS